MPPEGEKPVVLLHTHITNDAAEWLIRTGRVPGLEGWAVRKREASFGRSRFDFLLEKEGRLLLLEVKSCTLFGHELAMFPDAPSDRGRRHVEELGKLAGEGYGAAVLFLVQSSRPSCFLPDFHTDPKFAESLFRAKDRLRLFPLAVEWNAALELTGEPKLLRVPWGVYERHGGDRGDCLVIVDARKKDSGRPLPRREPLVLLREGSPTERKRLSLSPGKRRERKGYPHTFKPSRLKEH